MLRTVSFITGLSASLMLTLFPFLLSHVPQMRLHSALPVILLGIAGTMIYGIGYRPDNKTLRILFGPRCAWLLIGTGVVLLVAPALTR